MKMIVKPRIDEQNWCRCGACSHKLFRIKRTAPLEEIEKALDLLGIEVKCHSCKAINIIERPE